MSWARVTFASVCLLFVTVLSARPAVSASPDGELSTGEASPVAPVWPFVGVVDYSGVFAAPSSGERFDVGLRAPPCLSPSWAIHVGYSDEYVFFSRFRHDPQSTPDVAGSFVVPWGDAAYPLLTSPIVSWKLLRSSDYPFVMDRFSTYRAMDRIGVDRIGTYSPEMVLGDYYSHYQIEQGRLQLSDESAQPFTSLGFLGARIGPWWPGDEVLRFESDRGRQHYVLASSPRYDGFFSDIDREEAVMLLEAEDVDYGEPESEEGGWSPPNLPRVQRIGDELTVWSMGALNWVPLCLGPYSVVQDARTGLALSCTDSVLLPVGLPSRSDLSDVPPLRGLDECPETSWASILAADQNEVQAQGRPPRGESAS